MALEEIIDTHVHAWDLEKVAYSWLDGNNTILNQTFSLDELEPQHQELGITGGIMVQAANNLEDTKSMLALCREKDWLLGAVGWIPLKEPGISEEKIQEMAIEPYFLGIRHLIHDEPDPHWLLNPEVIHSFSYLEKSKIPFDVVANKPEHLDCILKLSEKYPDQFWCIDHLANPPIPAKERWGKWGEKMRDLSANPNVYIKISGLGMSMGGDSWVVEDLKPHIYHALELFGTHRAMLGGDWPVVLLCGGLKKSWAAYVELLNKSVSPAEMKLVYADNAKRFYKTPS
jgi:L-fuconolactonase